MKEELTNLKKVELHLHIDGAVSMELAKNLTGKSIEVLKKEMIAKDKCENLSEYLTKFELPIELMQTKENLYQISADIVDRLSKENIVYIELRFAPMFHTKKGLTYEEIVESVLKGLKSNPKIKTNLILCMMRGFPKENNLKTIEVAEKYLNKGVCAIDLAGAEDKYPLKDYVELFEIVKEKQIPYIIHAGENGDAKEVELAINLGAKRIGHGIHSIEDEKVLNLIKEKNILLEVCPTSNVQTNSVDTYQNHPIKKLYDLNIPISINTDNSTVSNITLTEEYIKLSNYFNFTLNDYKEMNKNAIKHSFLTKEEQEELLKLYD